MIHFENSDSPFFTSNKNFVLEILQEFGEDNFEGWCTAYGFDIKGGINKNNLNFFAHFEKSQTTQNGVIIPIDARDSTNIKIEVEELKTRFNFQYKQNPILKLINWIQYKLNLSERITEDKRKLIELFINENQIFKLKIKKGKLTLLTFNSTQKPAVLFTNLSLLISELNR